MSSTIKILKIFIFIMDKAPYIFSSLKTGKYGWFMFFDVIRIYLWGFAYTLSKKDVCSWIYASNISLLRLQTSFNIIFFIYSAWSL